MISSKHNFHTLHVSVERDTFFLSRFNGKMLLNCNIDYRMETLNNKQQSMQINDGYSILNSMKLIDFHKFAVMGCALCGVIRV